jgi:hypothetical protein
VNGKQLTAYGKKLLVRRKELKKLGLPSALSVLVDLENGFVSCSFPDFLRNSSVFQYTIPDLRPNVNVDIDSTDTICGFEDISAAMGVVVTKWVEALLIADRRLKAKKDRK